MITTEQIKQLREKTGISVMQCQKALEEAKGDMDKAFILLKKKGAEIASKKGDRKVGAGVVQAYIHATGSVGAMVELLCETDFVSGNDGFKTLAYDIAMHIAASNPEFLKTDNIPADIKEKAREVFEKEAKSSSAGSKKLGASKKPAGLKEKIIEGKLAAYFKDKVLLEQDFIKRPEITIKALIEEGIQKFGEKIEIGRFSRFAVK
jgi:elongation factor Ts